MNRTNNLSNANIALSTHAVEDTVEPYHFPNAKTGTCMQRLHPNSLIRWKHLYNGIPTVYIL